MKLAEANAFIVAKWTRPCDRCGQNEWILFGSPDVVFFTSITLIAEGSEARSAKTLPLYCANCGNLKHIHGSVLEEWLKTRKPT